MEVDNEQADHHLTTDQIAAAKASIEKPLLTDGLKCAVCLEYLRSPHTIPCGHTFCLRCLQTLARIARLSRPRLSLDRLRFHCPTCRRKTLARPILRRKAAVNYAIKEMINEWLESPFSSGRIDTVFLRSLAVQTDDSWLSETLSAKYIDSKVSEGFERSVTVEDVCTALSPSSSARLHHPSRPSVCNKATMQVTDSDCTEKFEDAMEEVSHITEIKQRDQHQDDTDYNEIHRPEHLQNEITRSLSKVCEIDQSTTQHGKTPLNELEQNTNQHQTQKYENCNREIKQDETVNQQRRQTVISSGTEQIVLNQCTSKQEVGHIDTIDDTLEQRHSGHEIGELQVVDVRTIDERKDKLTTMLKRQTNYQHSIEQPKITHINSPNTGRQTHVNTSSTGADEISKIEYSEIYYHRLNTADDSYSSAPSDSLTHMAHMLPELLGVDEIVVTTSSEESVSEPEIPLMFGNPLLVNENDNEEVDEEMPRHDTMIFCDVVWLVLKQFVRVFRHIRLRRSRLLLTLFWFLYGAAITCISQSFLPWMSFYTLIYFLIIYAELEPEDE